MSEYLYTTPPLDRVVGLRRHIMTTAMGEFGGWGYREIQVPLLHFFDALKPGLSETQIERSFRFVDRDGNLMVLRPDVTSAIAQTYANQIRNPALPLRVSYTHKIVRIERSFTRNELESYQVGIELIGSKHELTGDLEVLVVLLNVLKALGLPDYKVGIADHHMANILLRATGAPSRMRKNVREAIIARDTDEVREQLNRLGARTEYIDALLTITGLGGGLAQLDTLARVFPYDPVLLRRIEYLRTIYNTLAELGFEEHIDVELSELSGSSYYTGLGFSIVSEGVGEELGRGGRYDDLIGLYGTPTPAVGFSLTLETLVQALNPHIERLDAIEEVEHVVLTQDDFLSAFQQALEHRSQGKNTRLVSRKMQQER